jgi:hypothetical protein
MHKFRLVFYIAGFVFLGILFLMLLINLLKRNVYDPELGINVLLISRDGMGVISVRAESGVIGQMRLPDNLSIPIESNGAGYLVEAIYKIGLPVSDPLNSARDSVGQALGIVISGVVKAPVEFGVDGFRRSLVSVSTKTNLSLIDRYFLFKDINEKLGNRAFLSFSLPKNVIDFSDEPDGKKIGKLNSAVFVWSKNQWVVDEVLSETAEVTVVNASGKDGKARQVARQIESAGVRVIDILVAKKGSDNVCFLLGNTKAHPLTTKFLINSFLCEPSERLDLNDFIDHDVKSDLVVILGKQS